MRWRIPVVVGTTIAAIALSGGLEGQGRKFSDAGVAPAVRLAQLIDQALAVRNPTRSKEEYRQAAQAYKDVLSALEQVDRSALDLDNQVDYDLLVAHAKTRLFGIETVRDHELIPDAYLALDRTDALFLRPGALPDSAVRAATRELETLPEILANAKENLTTPARAWTEYAIENVYFAKLLLGKYAPTIATDDPEVKTAFLRVAQAALASVNDFENWLQNDLLPRSTRSAGWNPEWMAFYQSTHEQLPEYGIDAMLHVAESEERVTMEAMRALAKEIHPSGDLRRVWELMKEEALPWQGVVPLAQRYVDLVTAWLRGPGAHVFVLPDYVDYGARETTPMARYPLSFGGETEGPTLAGRWSGYYVMTPLDNLTPEEQATRLKGYNPYWVNVTSYHEWLGHTIHLSVTDAVVTRPIRRAYGGTYFGQAWSFYLEKLLEDEGYFKTLPYTVELKSRMARLQMRMWRIQRIITKCRMARAEMTIDQAVDRYVEQIGMEQANAHIEVYRDSQYWTPPGSEIIGEMEILKLREEYRRRMGEHYSLQRFNNTLITYGELPFKQIRRLMFRD